MSHPDLTDRTVYRVWTSDIARFGDTDRLGHINNAAYATFCETARAELLLRTAGTHVPSGTTFVLARQTTDFRAEMQWGGGVEIGTAVARVGRSSITLVHGMFKDGACCATAECVIVLIDEATRRSTPVPPALRAHLEALSTR